MLAAATITVYFFTFASPGLHSFWSHDDLANISRVQAQSIATVLRWNLEYFSPAYRPLGALYYRVLYEWFGLNALPLRIVCFAFLLAEFWLIYAITRYLTGSRETGAITTLLLCFHVNFEPMYYNSGMCYDVFCFLFYWAAFLYYARIRRDRLYPRWWQMIVIAALYICALNSKELAVTLPVIRFWFSQIRFRSPSHSQARFRFASPTMTPAFRSGA